MRMRIIFCLLIFCLAAGHVLGQAKKMTTVILIRHAEKGTDDPKDPGLSEAGHARAERLASVLKETKINAIYSTNYKRTKETAAVLAKQKGLEISAYEPMKAQVIDEIVARHKGETIVIVGHSNTTPWTANHLQKDQKVNDFPEDAFGNILIITLTTDTAASKMIWITY